MAVQRTEGLIVSLPDKSQHGLRGDGGRGRHDDQWFPEQHQLPQELQVDEDRLETPAQVTINREVADRLSPSPTKRTETDLKRSSSWMVGSTVGGSRKS